MKQTKNLKMVSYKFDDETIYRLKQLSEIRGESMSEVLRELVCSPRPVYSDIQTALSVVDFFINNRICPAIQSVHLSAVREILKNYAQTY